MADDVVVMYGGRVVERGSVRGHLLPPGDALHLGSARLGAADGHRPRRRGCEPIPGQPPSLIRLPKGCVFRPALPLPRARPRQPVRHRAAGPRAGHAGARGALPPRARAARRDRRGTAVARGGDVPGGGSAAAARRRGRLRQALPSRPRPRRRTTVTVVDETGPTRPAPGRRAAARRRACRSTSRSPAAASSSARSATSGRSTASASTSCPARPSASSASPAAASPPPAAR